MNELTLDGKTYVSSKRAAEITGYAKDYVGQLCREGHVEARLVGRNWYVLESSIREHRFGKPAEEIVTNKETIPNWNPSKYIAEEPTELPPLSPSAIEEVEAVIPTEEESIQPQKPILSDMESAWREWFTQKEELVAPEVPEVDAVEVEEIRDTEEIVSITYRDEPQYLPEEVVEEALPSQEAILDLSHREEQIVEEPEEAVIIEERIVRNTPRRRSLMGNRTIQSLFIGAALISVALAAVGTGFAQKVLGTNLYRLPEINFIAGVNEINK